MTFVAIAAISGRGLGSLAGSFTAAIPGKGRRSYGYALARLLISPRRPRLIRTVSIRPEVSLQPAEIVSVRNIHLPRKACSVLLDSVPESLKTLGFVLRSAFLQVADGHALKTRNEKLQPTQKPIDHWTCRMPE